MNDLSPHRPLLILDLDETLIYAWNADGQDAPRSARKPDFSHDTYCVLERPGLASFQAVVSVHYDLAVWTASTLDYAEPIVRKILGHLTARFLWGRERCTRKYDGELMEEYWVKDMKKVRRAGFDPMRVLAVDDTPRQWERSYGNLVRVRPFEGDPGDRDLEVLGPYLKSIAETEDFRRLEKRGWRNQEAGL